MATLRLCGGPFKGISTTVDEVKLQQKVEKSGRANHGSMHDIVNNRQQSIKT